VSLAVAMMVVVVVVVVAPVFAAVSRPKRIPLISISGGSHRAP